MRKTDCIITEAMSGAWWKGWALVDAVGGWPFIGKEGSFHIYPTKKSALREARVKEGEAIVRVKIRVAP